MKKILVVLMTCLMVLSMVACGNTVTTDSTTTTDVTTATSVTQGTTAVTPGSYPKEKVLIGVEIYDPTDVEFLEIKSYFNYLAETFNVEFKFSEAIKDANGEMKFIEDCAVSGCKGFMAYYNITLAEQPKAVMNYGMYYWGISEDAAIIENPLYLGAINSGDADYEGGKAIGEWAVAQGFDTVIFANGGADFGIPLFVDRQNGFNDGIKGSNIKVITVSGFPGEQFFADQAAALGTEGLDAVCASFNGLDSWAQPLSAAGLDKTVKIGTIGSLNQSYVDAMKAGSISLLVASNIQKFGFAVGMICNAVDGNADALKVDGKPADVQSSMWTIDNAQDAVKLFDIQKTKKIFTAEDIMSVCKVINPDASATTLIDLFKNATIENILKK